MFLRSTGWLCTATIFQALAPWAHCQVPAVTPAVSPTPTLSPSPSPTPAAQFPEADQWKVEAPADQEAQATPQSQPESLTNEAPFEQEPGWTGGLVGETPENASTQGGIGEIEPLQANLPVSTDPRSKGYVLVLGPIDIRPKMQFGVTYDDNILISSSQPKRDVLYTFSPGILLGTGDYLQKEYNFLRLEYQPSLTYFNHYSTYNSLEEYLRLESQYSLGPLALAANFEYDKLAGPDLDVGGRVNRDIYDTDLSETYRISDKTSLENDTSVWLRHYQNEIGSTEIIDHIYANYMVVPKLTLAWGTAFGLLQPDQGNRQTFQQALLRVRYASSAKLTFNGNVGLELREISHGPTRLTPVFGLSGEYELSAGTKLSINGNRSVTNSAALNGEDYTSTKVSLDLTQHLIGDFYLVLSGGFENDAYRGTTTTNSVSSGTQRNDNYWFFRPSLDYRVKDWASISVSYFYQTDNSTVPSNSFRDRQISLGVHIGF